MEIIACMRSDMKEKFGAPRQSGLAPHVRGRIVFEKGYRDSEALRGLEEFSHIWLLWLFSENMGRWSPTVRPPRLGGNRRVGVFACRSPFRPNPIGLSCVKLEEIGWRTAEGPVIHVSGADLIDGTPILDIKPYLPSADCIPGALSGFAGKNAMDILPVRFLPQADEKLSVGEKEAVAELLALDPRPRYHDDPGRIYGMTYSRCNVRFRVTDRFVEVIDAEPAGMS